MIQWACRGWCVISKPKVVALIAGVLAAWLWSDQYRLKLLWCKAVDPDVKHIVQSSSGVTRQYSKVDANRSWFVGHGASSPKIEMLVPTGAYFWGQDYFSPDGKWYAVNGSYQNQSGSVLFVFETGTGKMVSDVRVNHGSAELACFVPSKDLLVYRDSTDLTCWDIRANKLQFTIKVETLFVVLELACSHDGERLYGYGPVLKNMYLDENPRDMELRCWSIAEKRELFRVKASEHAEQHLWGLIADPNGLYLYGVFEKEGRRFEHHRDNNVVACWDTRNGKAIGTSFKEGGEAADPIYPLDINHYLVFLDPKPPAIRRLWKQWFKNEPGWLKAWLPYQCSIDVREAQSGATVQRLPVREGHWPRFDTCGGRYLETYARVQGREEIAYWRIEECDRVHEGLFLGSSVGLGSWVGLLLLGKVRSMWRTRRGRTESVSGGRDAQQ